MGKVRDDRCWVKDRRSWPGVLNRVFTASFWTALEPAERDGNQKRAGWTPRALVSVCVCLGWSLQRRLTPRLDEGRAVVEALLGWSDGLPTSYQGFFKQLCKHDVKLLACALTLLRSNAVRWAGKRWYRHNWVPFAVDGSRIDLPRTRRNESAMGRCGRDGSGPKLWVTMLCHLPTGMPWDWRQGPGTASERGHLREMIGSLPQDGLLIGDAGFVGYDMMCDVHAAGRSFLIRCGANVTLLTKNRLDPVRLAHRPKGALVYLWPSDAQAAGLPPLLLRLIVVKKGQQRVFLVTNVLSETALPKRMASEFYAARWGIEVGYRNLKQTMDHRKLLAGTPEIAAMEWAAYLFSYCVLILHGLLLLGPLVGRLDVAAALRALQRAISAAQWHTAWTAFAEQFRAATHDDYKRCSSKDARNWPHKKRDRPPGPPNLVRMNSSHRDRLRGISKMVKTG